MTIAIQSFVLIIFLVASTCRAQPSYSNVTLKASNGDLSVVVYLPQGIKPGERTYYLSTRFDHSSMIGSIKRTSTKADGSKETHVLYDTQQWRVPHDPYWPESGLGLAAEFGVGDDGAFCNFLCGWNQENEVTNGVLGYREAKNGESFLKIGVGELIKGSCITCDSTDDYRFNSPYQFAKTPVWSLEEHPEENSITLENEAVINANGYRIRKDIMLQDDELHVKTTLTNLGRIPFATAWYSHHFFTCDTNPVEKGYGSDLDVAGTGGRYEEPATWFWSTPLENYATVSPMKDKVRVEMQRGVERDVRVKAEFAKDDLSRGTFTIRGCENSIKESIPEVGTDGSGSVSMYAFNLYIETGTFSPEPQIYFHLFPGETTSWTQVLEFSDKKEEKVSVSWLHWMRQKTVSLPSAAPSHPNVVFAISAMVGVAMTVLVRSAWRRRQGGYSLIPDH